MRDEQLASFEARVAWTRSVAIVSGGGWMERWLKTLGLMIITLGGYSNLIQWGKEMIDRTRRRAKGKRG
ncbi:hypothetical protein BDV26DRAFT_265612 [Aspergillus bertholletiae]|uniref:Uncharacterized protein n=1 Tax=Aspergillus bertholletiae TaxID=1226010 RepID=A0A5N7B355_9EURO|nr:hypothetical protein BDV26DRAFT_265612 [Aspergillus bertholletiae]